MPDVTNEKAKKMTKKKKYITFFLEDEEYSIEIHKVKTILGMMEITPLPNTPNYIQGVINLRGKIVPIIDLRLKFGFDFQEYTDRTSIIVVEIEINNKTTPIGMVVDKVSEVLQVGDEDLEDTPYFGVNINTDFILGMAKVKDDVKILLDIDKVLTSEEAEIISKISKKNASADNE